MKKQILIVMAMIGFINAWATVNVSAQSSKAVKVEIGFDFQAKGKTFPAGEYYIESVSQAADNLLSIRGAGGVKNRLIIANQLYVGKIQQPKLIFERRGADYLLTGIFLESGRWGFSLPAARPKGERYTASAKAAVVEILLSK